MTLTEPKVFRSESDERKLLGRRFYEDTDWKGLHDQALRIAFRKSALVVNFKLTAGSQWELGTRLLTRPQGYQEAYSCGEKSELRRKTVLGRVKQLYDWERASRSLWKESVRQHSQPSSAYQSIMTAIASSESILHLRDDWDGEQAVGYQRVTWEKATEFLRKLARFSEEAGHDIGTPRISPADEGSIDIFWKNGSRELLVNIPADPGEITTYYGQNSRGDTMSGSINAETPRPELMLWLAQTRAI